MLRSRFAGWRRLFPYVLPRHALAGADFGTVWNERIVDPRTGLPIGSGPFLVQRWSRGRRITLVRTRVTGVGGPRTSTGSCTDSAATAPTLSTRRSRGCGRVSSTSPTACGCRPARLGRSGSWTASPFRRRRDGWEHLRFRILPPGHPRSATSWCDAIAHAIDRTALVRRSSPGSTAPCGATASPSPRPAATTSRTGASTANLSESRRLLSRRVAARLGRNLLLSRREALAARVHDRRRRCARAGGADPDGAAAARGRRARPRFVPSGHLFPDRPERRLRRRSSPI